ncbi:MAG: hypothetical protein EPO68_01960 [Planctomycetota bacterium]|nr:MAG: hypothetical protein EPO68_01960 [Planctomycetota bacterium]
MSTADASRVRVVGGGPAGAAAALAALAEGARVTIEEKSVFPRHKVCGEFLSPEIAPILDELGLGGLLAASHAARITRAALHIGGREKRFRLPETAYGLSRSSLDRLLFEAAQRRGAAPNAPRARLGAPGAAAPEPDFGRCSAVVIARGRRAGSGAGARSGTRIFGFKAHHVGAAARASDDAVELYFFEGGYCGVSPIENGAINVCGLAPEALLRARGFRPDALFPPALVSRLRGLERSFDWLLTGPLDLHGGLHARSDAYLAGDALSFVDPFTGSGILAALLTGRLAGRAAARRLSHDRYHAECRRVLRRQRDVAALLRDMLRARLSASLVRWIPGRLLYQLTRPAC